MAWTGPDWQNQCKTTDLAKIPVKRYSSDEDIETPQGHGLRGYEDIGRRPLEAVAGEIEDEEEADRQDKASERMQEYRKEYGGSYSRPPRGEDF